MENKIVKVEKLIKNYKNFQAVKKISFDVKAKEIFALVGPNGAGKSTTLKILATILSATSGKVEIAGYDLTGQADEIRKIISYLPEEAGAYKNLTGRAYLKFMAGLFTDSKIKQQEYLDFAYELSGLKDRLKDKVKTYSKGMTRKLLLARTVMSRPKLAILDEPTSGLDVINAVNIRKTVKDLAGQGMAVILSSHNMLEIEYMSDKIALLQKGEILATGTAQELKDKFKGNNLEEVFTNIV